MSDFRNRITGLEIVPATDLVVHAGNWRDHSRQQAAALTGVLSEVGIADALLAYRSERNGGKLTVIDGHLRRDIAPQNWPVLVLDVNDAEADYILATHDPLTAMADTDLAALAAILDTVATSDAAVQEMLDSMAEQVQRAVNMSFMPILEPEISAPTYNDEDVRNAQDGLDHAYDEAPKYTAVRCPHCNTEFFIDV